MGVREAERRWGPVRSENLGDAIVYQVKQALFLGELRPGDRLGSEASLGRSFNVSRATIRDALRTLEALGIVEIRLGGEGGAYVAQGNPKRLSDVLAIQFKLVSLTAEEIIDSQLVMESAALDLAMANATEQDVADLRTHQQAMLAARETPAAFNKRAMAFHQRLVASAHNRFLDAQFRALAFVLEPLMSHRTTPEVAGRVAEAYGRLVAHIASGDWVAARALFVERMRAAREREVRKSNDTVPGAGDVI